MYPYGLLVLRLALGAVFAAHGAQKLFGVWGGGGPGGTAAFFAAIGIAPAFPLALLLGFLEFAGGLLLAGGGYTLVTAGLLLLTQLVAVWKVHLPNGFFLNWTGAPGVGHGYEFNLVLIAALGCLMLAGPGAWSVDGRRVRSAELEAAGRARLRTGM
ncbi:MAG TPA: DoxX family protein [Vicinamibacterales bacterium]|nr:DoxX family protein [Vicinamibacterales bacterium]